MIHKNQHIQQRSIASFTTKSKKEKKVKKELKKLHIEITFNNNYIESSITSLPYGDILVSSHIGQPYPQ